METINKNLTNNLKKKFVLFFNNCNPLIVVYNL